MKVRLWFVLSIIVGVLFTTRIHAQNILFLVTAEYPAASSEWRMKTKVEKYSSSATSVAGKVRFTIVTEADCERRSSIFFDKELFYGIDGHTPPGIFFLDYYQADYRSNYIRHRLIISDEKGEIYVKYNGVEREGIQIHEISPNYRESMNSYITGTRFSKGCVVCDQENFQALFPDNYFENYDNSPFSNNHIAVSNKDFNGEGNILVFITDKDNAEIYSQQIDIFNQIVSGDEVYGLTVDDFDSVTSNMIFLRSAWKTIASPASILILPPLNITISRLQENSPFLHKTMSNYMAVKFENTTDINTLSWEDDKGNSGAIGKSENWIIKKIPLDLGENTISIDWLTSDGEKTTRQILFHRELSPNNLNIK